VIVLSPSNACHESGLDALHHLAERLVQVAPLIRFTLVGLGQRSGLA
jgi:hypothetical protein